MFNKIKDYLKKVDYRTVGIFLLFFAICFQWYYNYRMTKIYNAIFDDVYRSGYFYKDFGKFESKYHNKKIKRKNIAGKHIKNEKTKKKVNFENKVPFSMTKKFDKENNLFIVKVNVPSDMTEKDIKVNFQDNFLKLDLSKEIEQSDKNIDVKSFYDFSKTFKTPATKATINDVKKTLKDGVFIVKVPIIK